MASRWHPNDHRKIRRSLEIYYSTDCRTTASEVYAAQRASRNKTTAAEETSRSKHNNLIFWVHAETEVLRARLDGRVGKMMESGMWREIEEMEVLYNSIGRENIDLNSGIWQSIGFKEFLPYLDLRNSSGRGGGGGGGGGARREDEHTERTKDRAIEDMKTATRQYARSQTRWIRIKFLHALAANGGTGNLFLLDSTDSARYDDIVVKPGIQIAKGESVRRSAPPQLKTHRFDRFQISSPVTPSPTHSLFRPWRARTLPQRGTTTSRSDQISGGSARARSAISSAPMSPSGRST